MTRPAGVALGALGLITLGAGLMFFLDRRSGARRRAAVRDRTRHAYRTTSARVVRASTNVVNHSRGAMAMMKRAFGPTELPTDDVLLARVKSRIGHVVHRLHAIEIKADHGMVSVTGRLPLRDAQTLLRSLASVPGVSTVENHLAVETTH